MKNKSLAYFAGILFIIGLMMSTQYNTVNGTDPREVRGVWEIRQELTQEKQLHSELLSEISLADETLDNYGAVASESPEQALKETIEKLRNEAGLTEQSGPGLKVMIKPSLEAVALGLEIEQIAPDMLSRFLNEINRTVDAQVSVDGQRIINSTAIRYINGTTTINTRPLTSPPFEILVAAESEEDIERLYNQLVVSPIIQDLYIDNLSVEVSKPQHQITIPAYEGELNLSVLQLAEEE